MNNNTPLTPEDILPFQASFTDIYNKEGAEVNPIPEEVKVTVWCDDNHSRRGYCIDVTTDEMDLDWLIAKSWILHEQLLKYVNGK